LVRGTGAATNETVAVTNVSAAITTEATVVTNETAAITNATATATTAEPTIVTSERLNVDYLRNLGTFSGNVLVIDPRITLRADQMVVYFDESDPPAVQKIEASGAVVSRPGLESHHGESDGAVVPPAIRSCVETKKGQ
jgi:lipopolysaccharide export system protein LptA